MTTPAREAAAEKEPPALPGELWRGRVDISGGRALGALCVVQRPFADDFVMAQAACGVPECRSSWHILDGGEASRVFAAWAMAERARADAAAAALSRAEPPRPPPVVADLVAAIRAFTVDMPDDQPNGEAERHLLRLNAALDPEHWRRTSRALSSAAGERLLSEANGAAAAMCEALADDTQRLREAAEAFFGGDFRAPLPEAP